MIKTVAITGSIAILFLIGIIILTVAGNASLNAEYAEFVLALIMFATMLVGSYFWVVRGPGKKM